MLFEPYIGGVTMLVIISKNFIPLPRPIVKYFGVDSNEMLFLYGVDM